LNRARQGVERAAELTAADAWLVLTDRITEAEAALAELLAQRRKTGVLLSATDRITRTRGGLVQQLTADPEVPLPV
jgi:hypothetical protein